MPPSAQTDLPDFRHVEAAAKRLEGFAVKTPLIESEILNEMCDARIFLKAECLQRTGSFKFRGAFNTLSQMDPDITPHILASSSGNHAQGIAEAARILGFKATIIMPADAPQTKKDRTKRSGAEIVEYDRATEDRDALIAKLSDATSAPVVHPYENPHVIAGQGTAGLEAALALMEMGLTCDRALTCAGGGGLTAGTLIALQHHFPDVTIHPVEPEHYDDYRQSLQAAEIKAVPSGTPSVCDAILTPSPGKLSFAICQNELSSGLVVSDSEALAAVAFAFNELKLVVEPGGAVALAALISGKIDVSGEIVMATLSGGNIDHQILQQALADN